MPSRLGPTESEAPGGQPELQALIEEARRQQPRRRRSTGVALGAAAAIATATYLIAHLEGATTRPRQAHHPAGGVTAHQSPIRVTLTADDHHPQATNRPAVHWGIAFKVTTATGEVDPTAD